MRWRVNIFLFPQLPADPNVRSRLPAVFLDGQPLHVISVIAAISTKTYNVVHLIAWAFSVSKASCRTRVFPLKRHHLSRRTRQALCHCLEAEQEGGE